MSGLAFIFGVLFGGWLVYEEWAWQHSVRYGGGR